MKEAEALCMQEPGMKSKNEAETIMVEEAGLDMPSLLFLMETKASNLSCVKIRRKLSFDNIFCVESQGLCENFIRTKISSGNYKDWEATFEWRRVFQHATLSALPAISSDHTPLVLNLKPRRKRSRSFKFEAYWPDHTDCDTVIRRGWSSTYNSGVDHWTNLNRKMQNCKKELIK
ncbi:hypothetical protein Ahy_B06g080541 [Arachis hypogaea]|uniref:Endonuclease/exonuclease/phosphatase domain-containing protein n=1 Tax=Arachis hypogaea TaxID=3818 RepID=A0A444YIB6_ARAHY|nr:hypothetical protein Ahy_B06g080541 [Arachis hypogaea]